MRGLRMCGRENYNFLLVSQAIPIVINMSQARLRMGLIAKRRIHQLSPERSVREEQTMLYFQAHLTLGFLRASHSFKLNCTLWAAAPNWLNEEEGQKLWLM